MWTKLSGDNNYLKTLAKKYDILIEALKSALLDIIAFFELMYLSKIILKTHFTLNIKFATLRIINEREAYFGNDPLSLIIEKLQNFKLGNVSH